MHKDSTKKISRIDTHKVIVKQFSWRPLSFSPQYLRLHSLFFPPGSPVFVRSLCASCTATSEKHWHETYSSTSWSFSCCRVICILLDSPTSCYMHTSTWLSCYMHLLCSSCCPQVHNKCDIVAFEKHFSHRSSAVLLHVEFLSLVQNDVHVLIKSCLCCWNSFRFSFSYFRCNIFSVGHIHILDVDFFTHSKFSPEQPCLASLNMVQKVCTCPSCLEIILSSISVSDERKYKKNSSKW